MKKVILILFLLLPFVNANAQSDSIHRNAPKIFPKWTVWVPGATHFYEGNFFRGTVFSTLEIGGIASGIFFNKKLKTQSSTPYANFPLLLGMQAYNIDKCHWLRQNLKVAQYYQPSFQYDTISFNNLMKAPFKPANIFTPITGGFVLVALAELYWSSRNATHRFSQISQMRFFDQYLPHQTAMPIYSTVSLASAFGAGVAEEYYFRNGFLPVFDYRYGQKRGLIYSSLFFGAMHFSNILFSNNTDYAGTLLQVAEASIAGYFLGRDVQKRGYKIGPAVAAHVWYDFTLMLGSFLIDPDNNFLGINIRYKIQ